ESPERPEITDEPETTAEAETEPGPEPEAVTEAAADPEPGTAAPRFLARPATTRILGGVLALLVLASVVMVGFAVWEKRGSEESAGHVLSFDQPYQVSDRPVQI